MFRSKNFYVKLRGDIALFTNPATKGGGERASYAVPSRQALQGAIDAIYHKPTITNVISEVKVINQIRTEVHGIRSLLGDYGADLSYVSYLSDVEYLIKFNFIWNENRSDLIQDRNVKKHEAIMERSIKRGGRRDVFLGTRECLALVDAILQEEYESTVSYYEGQTLDLGIMFHSFAYPNNSKELLQSYFTETQMVNGVITFKKQVDCEIKNQLSNYAFKTSTNLKSVNQEFEEYEAMEKGEC